MSRQRVRVGPKEVERRSAEPTMRILSVHFGDCRVRSVFYRVVVGGGGAAILMLNRSFPFLQS